MRLPRPISINKDRLETMFVAEGLSTDEIAGRVNLKRATVNYYLRKYNIRHRELPKECMDRDYMYNLFVKEGLTVDEISELVGISYSTVYNVFKKLDIDIKDRYSHLYQISDIQHDIIIGSLLGDGSLNKAEVDYRLTVSHAENQKGYLEGKFKIMKKLCNIEEIKCYKSNKSTHQNLFYFYTKCISQLNEYSKMSIKDQLDSLNENSFVVWLMDDGYHNVRKGRSPNYSIAARRFTRDEIYHSIKVLKDKFDINAKIDMRSVVDDKHMGIKFNVEESEKIKKDIIDKSELSSLIKSSMSYKYYDYKNNLPHQK